ncbi:site-specific integrase [Allisonella histaminiformans]|uniref:tyrosine-type recombinase/integrase n=1 Tax=Allisonella histaminiformans TaxID=209880 RepID=UPI002E795317|nr:site-specific integrase [Allisonella histaminiformans]
MAYIRKHKLSNGKLSKNYYFTVSYVDDNGKNRKVERVGTDSLTETKRLAMLAQAQLNQSAVVSSTMKYSDFLTTWDNDVLNTDHMKENTVKQYRSVVVNHIIPGIGNRKLNKLTPRIIQSFINSKKSDGCSKSTCNTILSVIKKSLEYAVVYCGYLSSNPAADVHLPRYIQAPKQIAPFTPGEIENIFVHFKDAKIYPAILLSYHTGLRLGECCALAWSDIDMENHTISVSKTVVGDDIQPLPKSKSSCRIVTFGVKLYHILEDIRLEQMKNRMKFGKFYINSGLVCTVASGQMLLPNDFRYFNMWCKEQFGHGSFHVLRHTFATNLLEAGASLEMVSKTLGHSTLNLTASTYSHVLDKRRNQLASIMDAAL